MIILYGLSLIIQMVFILPPDQPTSALTQGFTRRQTILKNLRKFVDTELEE